jgi:Zn-finger nucleic acid-binding protein
MNEHYYHDACPKCGANSVPAEKVPDQALRGCPKCEYVWFENLDKPRYTFDDYRDAQLQAARRTQKKTTRQYRRA